MFVTAEPCLRGASCCRVFAATRAFPCLSMGLPSSLQPEMPQLAARQAQTNRGDLWTALQALHSIYEVGSLHRVPSCDVKCLLWHCRHCTHAPAKLSLQGGA